MARVAGHRVVAIAVHLTVVAVGLAAAVAHRAVERLEVVGGRVALGARPVVRTAQREAVREAALRPGRVGRAMARVAAGREAGGDMVRIPCRVVERAMAPDAVARCAAVDVVAMAGRARGRRMAADEGEHAGVVERRATPRRVRGPMARVARGREPCGTVRWGARPVVECAMAADAVARGALVDVVLVAGRRRWSSRGVPTSWKTVVVIEAVRAAVAPGGVGRAMARLAGGGEPGGTVGRGARAVVVCAMAADAVARRALVDVVLVAGGAGGRRVGTDQLEDGVVIEAARAAVAPGGVGRAMARLAGGGEAGLDMVRGGRAVVVGLMAADAVARRALVDVVLVTGGAGGRRVGTDQLEDGVVIEAARAAVTPGGVGRAMARLAGGGEPRRHV